MYSYDDPTKYQLPPKFKEDRSLWKYILLRLATLTLYDFFFWSRYSMDFNRLATRNGNKTFPYALAEIIGALTLNIVMFSWFHTITEQLIAELKAREIDYKFDTKDFWIWCVFGTYIFVGQYVFAYKLIKALNLIAKDQNEKNAKMVEEAIKNKKKTIGYSQFD